MGLGDHLDVDAHSYVDGQSATTGSVGMTNGRDAMIVLLVGEQAEVESSGEE